MTTSDPYDSHAIDVRGLDRQAAQSPSVGSPSVGSPSVETVDAELHLLRLVLDQQVDAMLLTLGATAGDLDDIVPCQRWLAQDLEVARMLTTTLVESDVDLTSALGGISGGSAPSTLDHLLARYASMDALLTSMLSRPSCGQSWRATAAETRVRCRQRLKELHGYRAAVHRLDAQARTHAGVHVGSRTQHPTQAPTQTQAFLPGELLG